MAIRIDKKGRLYLRRRTGSHFTVLPDSLKNSECPNTQWGISLTSELLEAFQAMGAWENSYKENYWLTFPRRVSDIDIARTILRVHPELKKYWWIPGETPKPEPLPPEKKTVYKVSELFFCDCGASFSGFKGDPCPKCGTPAT